MRDPALSIIVVPEDGGASRTFRISRRRQLLMKAGAVALAAVLVVLLGSWLVLAVRAARVPGLEERIASLELDRTRTSQLVQALDALEERYERLRIMLGSGSSESASGLWLPPPASGRAAEDGEGDTLPVAWPLADQGFVTQSLLEGEAGDHPGVDIAVPADTYIRAAGGGIVAEVGEDLVYGRYVALDHGQGYSSLYAHASSTFVEQGQVVRRGEVIALSGNTGRSTAPHLHFEIMREGVAVDPLTLVRPPG
jgi:murein DD-endopeptidase MepM/ murein hydrolase activator NlpD